MSDKKIREKIIVVETFNELVETTIKRREKQWFITHWQTYIIWESRYQPMVKYKD